MELEKLGYQLTATDYSEDMLACARRTAANTGSKVLFERQDMRALDVSGKPFDVVICLFDSIGYVETNEALAKVARGVHGHLRPGGLFIFEFWHAGAMLRSYDPIRVRRWSLPGCELVRISETEVDCARQVARVSYTIYELRADGTYTSLRETQTNRYFLLQEVSFWISASGFTPVEWFAGFTFDKRITEDTWHIVAVVRVAEDG
jgi:SAM-dependent methyltransferase